MQVKVEGHQIDVGDALRTHVEEHLLENIKKYFQNPIEASVKFSKEADYLYRADVQIHVGKGILLQAHNSANDPYPAFDGAAERLSKRMRRYKGRLKNHHNKIESLAETDIIPASYKAFAGDIEEETQEGEEPTVVAEMNMQVLPLAVSDAVMRLELADAPALMFRNVKHGGLNMVYRRKDGNIGWVDPDGNSNQK